MGRAAGMIVWSFLVALTGCAGRGATASRDPQRELRATLVAVYEAVERGDEQGYRGLVGFPATDRYSDALTATMFQSIRLHQAVERHLGVGTTRPTTRGDASLAAVDYRASARAMRDAVAGWTFTARGDRATIDQLESRPGAPALRRVRGRWRLVPTPWDASPDTATYRLMVESERRLAAALAAAREAVEGGRAMSIDDVNAVLRSLLTDTTTTTTSTATTQPAS